MGLSCLLAEGGCDKDSRFKVVIERNNVKLLLKVKCVVRSAMGSTCPQQSAETCWPCSGPCLHVLVLANHLQMMVSVGWSLIHYQSLYVKHINQCAGQTLGAGNRRCLVHLGGGWDISQLPVERSVGLQVPGAFTLSWSLSSMERTCRS